MAMWHTSAGRLTPVSPLSAWRNRLAERRGQRRRGPTILAWQDNHDAERDGYHESLGAHRPEVDPHRHR
jgi:hypothetical protein